MDFALFALFILQNWGFNPGTLAMHATAKLFHKWVLHVLARTQSNHLINSYNILQRSLVLFSFGTRFHCESQADLQLPPSCLQIQCAGTTVHQHARVFSGL